MLCRVFKYNCFLFSIILLLFSLAINTTPAKAHDFPHSIGYVNDFASIMDVDTVSALDSAIGSFNRQTGIQIAVVTVKTTGELGIDKYANELFFKHGAWVLKGWIMVLC